MNKFMFVTAGGRHPEYNMGHLSRCVMLDSRIKKYQTHQSYYLINADPIAKKYLRMNNKSFSLYASGGLTAPSVGMKVKKFRPDIIIMDRLNFTAAEVRYFKNMGAVTIVLDDLGSGAKAADISINGLLLNSASDYSGHKHMILSSVKVPSRKLRKTAKKCLISFGGNEPEGLSKKIIQFFMKCEWPKDFHVIIYGSAKDGHLQFRNAAGRMKFRLSVRPFSDGFFKDLATSDLAIPLP